MKGEQLSEKLRQRSTEEGGFSLIELLVVILVIGILAAIAIPSLINQKGKANDASAKEQARTLQTVAETVATDNNGSYAQVKLAKLKELEPTLHDELDAKPSTPGEGKASEYEVQSESVATGDKYKILRNASGEVSRTCEPEDKDGCPKGGKW
jgi:type IV pilus assembly protein PilA